MLFISKMTMVSDFFSFFLSFSLSFSLSLFLFFLFFSFSLFLFFSFSLFLFFSFLFSMIIKSKERIVLFISKMTMVSDFFPFFLSFFLSFSFSLFLFLSFLFSMIIKSRGKDCVIHLQNDDGTSSLSFYSFLPLFRFSLSLTLLISKMIIMRPISLIFFIFFSSSLFSFQEPLHFSHPSLLSSSPPLSSPPFPLSLRYRFCHLPCVC